MGGEVDPQAILDEHTLNAATGRCHACGTHDCTPRREALAALVSKQVLPVRTPGATLPGHVGLRRVA